MNVEGVRQFSISKRLFLQELASLVKEESPCVPNMRVKASAFPFLCSTHEQRGHVVNGGRKLGEKTDVVIIERERYEALLIELGELRKLDQILSQYREELQEKDRQLKDKDMELEEVKEILLEMEWKDYELDQSQKRVRELELEVERLKSRGFWKRLFG